MVEYWGQEHFVIHCGQPNQRLMRVLCAMMQVARYARDDALGKYMALLTLSPM